jgi:hypothetical protein
MKFITQDAYLTPGECNNIRMALGGKLFCYIYANTVKYTFTNLYLYAIYHLQSQLKLWSII